MSSKQKQQAVYQAITTKFHGPTNHKGARISASCEAGRVYVPYDHALGSFENHQQAVFVLVSKLNWLGGGREWVGGALKIGYVFVDASSLTE